MTAEIAILNKSAIALAADSAVTYGTEQNFKVYQSENKLFSLSKYHPVGLMVYGQATFMDTDWETIVKAYRDDRGSKSFARLSDNVFDFLSFLETNKMFFQEWDQDRFIASLVMHEFAEILKGAQSLIDSQGIVSDDQKLNIVKLAISSRRDMLRRHKDIMKVDGSPIDADSRRSFRRSIRPFAVRIRKHIFRDFELDGTDLRRLNDIAGYIFTKQTDVTNPSSGVVVAGYGTEEAFPRLEQLKISGIFLDTLQFSLLNTVKIDKNNGSAIVPLAQSAMVHIFMQGVDSMYQDHLERYFDSLLEQYGNMVLDAVGFAGPKRSHLQALLTTANEQLTKEFHSNTREYRQKNSLTPWLIR